MDCLRGNRDADVEIRSVGELNEAAGGLTTWRASLAAEGVHAIFRH